MKKFLYVLGFLFLTPFTLGIIIFLLFDSDQSIPISQGSVLSSSSTVPNSVFAALPPAAGSISFDLTYADARPEIIRQYLEIYDSPMLPFSDFIFQISQKYSLDYRLIVAIAQCESNLCKKSPPDSFNCWGFENGETRFLSWEQAIEQVAKTLKEGYIDQGLVTPEQIMPKYAPPSVEKGGPWARCVSQFMAELE